MTDAARLGRGDLLLLGLVTTVLAETIRVAFPLLYDVRETDGATAAVGWAVALFVALPLLTPLAVRLVGTDRTIRRAAALLAMARIASQLFDPITLFVVGFGVVAGLVGTIALLHGARSDDRGGGAAVAILAGLALDQAIHGAFSTWDPTWQAGWVAGLVGAGVPGLLLVVTLLVSLDPPAGPVAPRGVLSLAATGPFLFLHLVFWGNAAFVGAELGWPLAVSVAWVLAAATLAVWAAARAAAAPPGPGVRGALAAGFVVGIALLALAGGVLVAVGALVAAGSGGALLALALGTEPGEARGHDGWWRTAAALALGMTIYVAFAFAYQIDVNVPLPVPRATFPIMAAGLVSLVALRPRTRDPEPLRTAVLVPLGLLAVVPTALLLTGSRPDPVAGDGQAVVVDWNIHTAVDADGQIDLEGVAALIEAQDPDVVVLQEVGRGWPIAGSIDQLEWLSRRLDMPYAWAKAGDDQFGNAVLSRLPIGDVEILGLPYGEGPQWRSALRVAVEIAPGEILPVIGVHLQNDESRAATRTAQIEALLAHWGDDTAVLTGDFNMQPTEVENRMLIEGSGYVSVQDTIGDPSASTARDPLFDGDRVDWLWVRGAVDPRAFEILRSEASDHLPLRAVVRLGFPSTT